LISDGMYPNIHTLNEFNNIIDNIIRVKSVCSNYSDNYSGNSCIKNNIVINMQCRSGLGRAPTMLAYLMMTRCGYNNNDTVATIRKKRAGAFNTKQLVWI